MGFEARGRGAAPSCGRVLVIDDDAMLADVVVRYLDREGFEVEVCGNGRDGLERALLVLPDLVVLEFDNGVRLALPPRRARRRR